jgi:hypothetical protein
MLSINASVVMLILVMMNIVMMSVIMQPIILGVTMLLSDVLH